MYMLAVQTIQDLTVANTVGNFTLEMHNEMNSALLSHQFWWEILPSLHWCCKIPHLYSNMTCCMLLFSCAWNYAYSMSSQCTSIDVVNENVLHIDLEKNWILIAKVTKLKDDYGTEHIALLHNISNIDV